MLIRHQMEQWRPRQDGDLETDNRTLTLKDVVDGKDVATAQ